MEVFRNQVSSPRISFSLDFAPPGYGSSRVSPEKPVFEGSVDTEFEFRMFSNQLDLKFDGDPLQLGGCGHDESMVSADKLFSDGKLRPLFLPPPPPPLPPSPPVSDCFLCSPLEHKLALWKVPSGPRFNCSGDDRDPVPCLSSGGDFKSSSPPRPPLPPVSPKSPRKYSAKIMHFFKPNKAPLPPLRVESSPQPLPRHDSDAASCKPLSPKAFWPFSRSNSAGESKPIAPAVPALPRRSNSASMTTLSAIGSAETIGIAKPYGNSGCSTVDSSILQGKINCFSIPIRGSERTTDRADSTTCISPVHAAGIQPSSSTSQQSGSLSVSSSSARKFSCLSFERADCNSRESGVLPNVSGPVGICASPKQSDDSSNAIVAFKDLKKTAFMNANRPRIPASPVRTARKGVSSTSRIITGGSPGRRGISNGLGTQSNARRVVLRNLQRRSAGTSLGIARKHKEAYCRDGSTGLKRHDSHSVTETVAPVHNAAMIKREAPITSLLNFGKLFSSKSGKPVESPLNNWRNGA